MHHNIRKRHTLKAHLGIAYLIYVVTNQSISLIFLPKHLLRTALIIKEFSTRNKGADINHPSLEFPNITSFPLPTTSIPLPDN